MNYPKQIMSTSELISMGFKKEYLLQMAHRPGQKYCTRMSNKVGSKIMFDTEKFEKERLRMVVR